MTEPVRITTQNPVVSPREAAYVSGLSEKTVQQAIDRHEIQGAAAPDEEAHGRGVSYDDLVYLSMRKRLSGLITGHGALLLREELMRQLPGPESDYHLQVGPLSVSAAPDVHAVNQGLTQLKEVRAVIVRDPEVLGGEPVVAGTRIGVYFLAELAGQGAEEQELLEDYPALTPHTLQAALTYARVYPRRGRPRKAPWPGGTVLKRRRR
ncbi:MAG TPA: DUF433 domain-containing protein [Longimicrobiaceae bacterium]|nr:DUF433 domain-containing protein [Longimicrobiaceae bacterium]